MSRHSQPFHSKKKIFSALRVNDIVTKDRIGAFCHHTHVEMEGASHGSLLGLTFAVKDIYDVAGHRTGFGSPDWLRTHGPATRTAPVVQRLLDAGAHLVGKTNTDELTWSLTGENAHYGAPVNVNAPGRITGGSSSGSASAVAAGMVDFAVGSDTGGSVRLPASFCGILGMRPTRTSAFPSMACVPLRRALIPAAGLHATPGSSSAWGAPCSATIRPRPVPRDCSSRRTRWTSLEK
jgi:Asp-tRNA(Asn)/Glu-tRNA(Gln) amidotransferase A subunit family amidase